MSISSGIINRETLSAFRKNATRKRKLLDKWKIGKKQVRRSGRWTSRRKRLSPR